MYAHQIDQREPIMIQSIFGDKPIKEIPCLSNKCILYPVCRNKEFIDCWDLFQHVIYLATYFDEFTYKSHGLHHLPEVNKYFIWDVIRNTLKRVTKIPVYNNLFIFDYGDLN